MSVRLIRETSCCKSYPDYHCCCCDSPCREACGYGAFNDAVCRCDLTESLPGYEHVDNCYNDCCSIFTYWKIDDDDDPELCVDEVYKMVDINDPLYLEIISLKLS